MSSCLLRNCPLQSRESHLSVRKFKLMLRNFHEPSNQPALTLPPRSPSPTVTKSCGHQGTLTATPPKHPCLPLSRHSYTPQKSSLPLPIIPACSGNLMPLQIPGHTIQKVSLATRKACHLYRSCIQSQSTNPNSQAWWHTPVNPATQ